VGGLEGQLVNVGICRRVNHSPWVLISRGMTRYGADWVLLVINGRKMICLASFHFQGHSHITEPAARTFKYWPFNYVMPLGLMKGEKP
jgi:hypothetical protein